MKYTADCPECLAEFEITGPRAAERGVHCARCGHVFTPEKIHRGRPTEEEEANARKQTELNLQAMAFREAARLKSHAENIAIINFILFIVAILAVLYGFGNDSAEAFVFSGSVFSLTLVLFIVAQLIHIRAALERLNGK